MRIPSKYQRAPRDIPHRLLLVCPVFKGDPLKLLNGFSSIRELADKRDWFVLIPAFQQEREDVRDRRKSYYYPEHFSGKAVLEALTEVARKYPVDTERLLVQGLSGGAQFAHRFAIWAPERVTAVGVNSSSWFDEPNEKSRAPAWLVTIGDSDGSYDASLQFVDQLRQVGAAPIFRSYVGMKHEGDPGVEVLTEAFLEFYDELTRSELGRRKSMNERDYPEPTLESEAMPFIGDSQDWRFFPNTEGSRAYVPEDTQTFIPSDVIAGLWGTPAEE